jgi:hypothetical protein
MWGARTSETIEQRLGDPPDSRLLIIEGEDLGMAHSVDDATFKALQKGWITSASILVPAPWFPEVVAWARNHPDADLGVQFDLNSDWTTYRWRPVSPQPAHSTLEDSAGYLPLSEMYVLQHANPQAAAKEVEAQMQLALRAGIHPTHLDNHMGAMMLPGC